MQWQASNVDVRGSGSGSGGRRHHRIETTTSKSLIIKQVISTLLLTPLSIIYFIIIDIVFLFHMIISVIIYICSCRRYTPKDLSNKMFIKIFGLNYVQITGYRRCRTLSQLMFESFVQITLQMRILTNKDTRSTALDKQIDLETIGVSLCIATGHALIEVLMLYIEANAANMDIVEYGIVCLSGRLEWVPFSKYYRKLSTNKLDDNNSYSYNYNYNNNENLDLRVLDYDDLQGTMCKHLSYHLAFEFSKKTVKNLTQLLNMIPTSNSIEKISTYRPHIKLGGKSCVSLDLSSIFDIYKAAHGRMVINWDHLNWDVIFANSIDTKDAPYAALDAKNSSIKRLPSIEFIRLQRSTSINSSITGLTQVDLVKST